MLVPLSSLAPLPKGRRGRNAHCLEVTHSVWSEDTLTPVTSVERCTRLLASVLLVFRGGSLLQLLSPLSSLILPLLRIGCRLRSIAFFIFIAFFVVVVLHLLFLLRAFGLLYRMICLLLMSTTSGLRRLSSGVRPGNRLRSLCFAMSFSAQSWLLLSWSGSALPLQGVVRASSP